MRRTNLLFRFFVVFASLYGTLIFPWPGWNAIYGKGYRGLNGLFLASEGPGKIVRFRASDPGKPLDTEIVVIEAGQAPVNGMFKARILCLDSRGVGWIPTALLMALIISTPIPWRRRLWALAIGMVTIHLFIVFIGEIYLWNETLPLEGSDTPVPERIERWIAGGLEETLVVQLGASFVVPAIVWIMVTFNREDLDRAQLLLDAQRR